jgi:hypothetical protein
MYPLMIKGFMHGKRYLVRIANSDSVPVSQYPKVRERIRSALEVLGCTLNSSRISTSAIEIDFFAPGDEEGEKAVRLLSRIDRVLTMSVLSDQVEDTGSIDKTLELARRLFNEERFWEVHEVVEGIWRRAAGSEKNVQQGIILYAAAFVHHQKNERDTTVRMLKRAVGKMIWPQDSYHCFDLQLMKKMAVAMIESGKIEPFKLP